MKNHKSQTGSIQAVIAIVLVVALIGTLGFVFWNNVLNKKTDTPQTSTKPKVEGPCAEKENTAAEKGVFCSKEVGIKFTVPTIFTNKLAKADNYEVFKSQLDPSTKTSAGMSENVYSAAISGNDNFTFTIAQEPMRTGYIGAFHQLQNTYFDQATGDLTLVTSPSRYYDAATGTYTTSGSYAKGEVVPSFVAGGLRFFKAVSGDAGVTEKTYVAIINGSIVKISLKNSGYIGNPATDPTTIDATKVFDQLDAAIKAANKIK